MRSIAMTAILSCSLLTGCNKLDEFNETPNLTPLTQGFRTSAAIGYCASLVVSAFNGENLPSNVIFEPSNKDGYEGAGILRVTVTPNNPLPFNNKIGDIVIAALWNNNKGVMSVVFADIDFVSSDFEFYGLHTVPISFNDANATIRTLFAEQDIVIGEGSDTLLNLSLSQPKFDLEQERLNSPHPSDFFTAIAQKVWFMDIDRNIPALLYDDTYTLTGGGQIVEATSSSGGVLYHAIIDAEFSYQSCPTNPVDGTAFIQNLKVGSTTDLGNLTFKFHDECDGKADVIVATGKYIGSNGAAINLNWQ